MADVNLDELMKQKEEADQKKGWLNLAGTIGQNMTAAPSFAELYTGRKGYHPDVKSVTDAAVSTIEDPVAKQMKTYELFKAAKENEATKRQSDEITQDQDPNSMASKSLKAIAGKWGIQVTPEMSAYDIKKMIDPKKMNETEAESRAKFGNEMAIHKFDKGVTASENQKNRDAEMERLLAAEKAKAAKGKEPKELTTGAAENIAGARSALSQLDNFEKSVKGTSDFTKLGVLNPARYTPGTDTNNRSETYRNQAKAMMQSIGTFLENGKLTDVDFASKYLPMAPAIDDSDVLRANKLASLKKLVSDKMKNDVDTYGRAGYDTRGFANMNVPETLNPLDKPMQKRKASNLNLMLDTANADDGVDPDAKTYAQIHNLDLATAQKIISQRKARGSN